MDKTVNWRELDEKPYLPLAEFSRKTAADGCVLLKNKEKILPLNKDRTISLFGRAQIEYLKSGSGSGGLVNADKVVNIAEGLRDSGIPLNEELASEYEKWLSENKPIVLDEWQNALWCQEEWIPDDSILKQAREISDTAVIVIARIAGETRDNAAQKGSWYLTDNEEQLLEKVSEYFERTVVLLNVGNIMDMNWAEKYNIKSVMYIWQGGQEGGHAVADVLSGRVSPSGRLTDTIAKDISMYPSTENFGDENRNFYKEDIYVGYRYFETFAKDQVLYPFGFGLSYTEFAFENISAEKSGNKIAVELDVKNIGDFPSREVVQVYAKAPQGRLGKSERVLCGFAKTDMIEAGKTERVRIETELSSFASYDDSGCTGNKSCYVLEKGEYVIYAGKCVRCAEPVLSFDLDEDIVCERLTEAVAPMLDFDVLTPVVTSCGIEKGYKPVSTRTVDYDARIRENLPAKIEFTGDRGIKLQDVKDGKNTLSEFVAQLNDEELMWLVHGEGMCSAKTRPGCAGAFGGITEKLSYYGIPVACVADGPSGIRMDNGDKATSMPSGTAIASTWDIYAAEKLYELLSIELCTHKIDSILGPGMNIHRSPLNGRNFEYYSEDPYLTGKMGAAQVRGVKKYGNSATIKHFAANSQEFERIKVDSAMSERAAREIYLKGFEIAVKEGGATSLMTSYNPLNGIWTANNYDLVTVILRGEWGYDGFVMSDWWPMLKFPDGDDTLNLKNLVEAQNDVYMVTRDIFTCRDNLKQSLENGDITVGQLQRNIMNILKYIVNSHSMERFADFKFIGSLVSKLEELKPAAVLADIETDKEYHVKADKAGRCLLAIEYSADVDKLEQINLGISINNVSALSATVAGSEGKSTVIYYDIDIPSNDFKLKAVCKSSIKISKITILAE